MSITRAVPIKASSGTWSIAAPVATKCIGASMCVPLCAPIEYTDSVSLSPFRMSFRKSNFMGASPAYPGVVAGSSVAVTSIHPSPLSSLVPGSWEAHPTTRASNVHVFSVCGTVVLEDSLMSQVTPRGTRDRRRRLQSRKLALEQRRRHEVPAALRHALREERAVPREIHKPHIHGATGAQQVAIAPLERGTRDDEADSCALRFAQSGRDLAEPAVAVGVGQRYPSGHALHIVRWMQVIAFDELDVERASELRSDQALAGAADAHHHVEPSVHSADQVAPIVYHRGIRGYRAGPHAQRRRRPNHAAVVPVAIGMFVMVAVGVSLRF